MHKWDKMWYSDVCIIPYEKYKSTLNVNTFSSRLKKPLLIHGFVITSLEQLIPHKSPKLETSLEHGPSHLYSCNDLTTICFKLIGQLKAPT